VGSEVETIHAFLSFLLVAGDIGGPFKYYVARPGVTVEIGFSLGTDAIRVLP
jgi:hypothetical protein